MNRRYILGLDLGANSIGWAVLRAEAQEAEGRLRPAGVELTGVRVFEAGVEGDLASGKDQSRGVKRRQMRAQRRLTERRGRRLKKLFRLLQEAGLLPAGPAGTSEDRHKFFLDLDRRLGAELFPSSPKAKQGPQPDTLVWPYLLRAKALDQKLTPDQLGRALYHLAQRRGFKSNRLAAPKEDEDKGVVRQHITELQQKMEEAGARTLGEYFSRLNPEQERIRSRYTSRRMYEDEFEKIWTAQQPHHPDRLTPDLKNQIYQAIFYQRPLRKQKDLIGQCELEPGRKRAPWGLLAAQRFRLLQQVNHTTVTSPEGRERFLSPEERDKLVEALEDQGDITFKRAKELLGFSKEHVFNWEEGGEKRFLGNRTVAELVKVFGPRWQDFTPQERLAIVEDLVSVENPETLARRGMKAWGLNQEEGQKFAQIKLETGYCRLSRQALAKILPHMEAGQPYMTAVQTVYGPRPAPRAADFLPPLSKALPELRNPAVARALTELRKVVNALIRRYGKPEIIRIELARDLKKSRQDRQKITQKYRANEKRRQEAAEKIRKEMKIQPSRTDNEKYRLAEECGRRCPYTGRGISMPDLFGPAPQFDIEHIIPLPRSLDNSFFNKTLCWAEENRKVKHNQTPYEAYGADPERWSEIIERVKSFQGDAAREKLRRFTLTETEDFEVLATRQLNDTRYASRLAREYLGLLYGGEGEKRTQVGRGQVTAWLRAVWGLNRILGDGGQKTRADHRHHAVDAVAVALTDSATIHLLSRAAARAPTKGRKLFAPTEPPWEGFLDEVRRAIERTVVSPRLSRKVKGPLHEETYYAPGPEKDPHGRPTFHVRKPLRQLSKNEVREIVDPVVRARVQAKLTEIGGDPKKFSEQNLPYLEAKDGRQIPIRKVRLKKNVSALPLSHGARRRHVLTGANHHLEILGTKDRQGRPKWEGRLVTLLEAARRLKEGEPVVQRDHGPDRRFLFTLAPGEVIELDTDKDQRALFRVRSIWFERTARVAYVSLNDARRMQDIKKSHDLHSPTIDTLRKSNCRKVLITPLGEVRPAND